MMKNRIGVILIGIATVALTGCTYLQSYFPDKERDYQYTTEIPLINYPAELRKNQPTSSVSVASPSVVKPDSSNTDDANDDATPPATENASGAAPDTTTAGVTAPITPVTESDDKDTVSDIKLLKYDDGESRLRIGAGFSKSWRVVSKALSRKSIEVTERNHEQGLFTIQFDPDEKKVTDESFMDELSFIVHGINSNEKEYFLKLEEHDQQTDVIVLNDEHLPLPNDDAALRLLKVLADTVNADLAKKAK
jgi:outer membrane protein assembly factor BamC